MDYPYISPYDFIKRNGLRYYPRSMAYELGINVTHIYRAKKGDYTPLFVRTLRKKGFIPPRAKRTRFTADIPKHLKDEIQAERDRVGQKNNGDFLELLWLFWKHYHVEEDEVK